MRDSSMTSKNSGCVASVVFSCLSLSPATRGPLCVVTGGPPNAVHRMQPLLKDIWVVFQFE